MLWKSVQQSKEEATVLPKTFLSSDLLEIMAIRILGQWLKGFPLPAVSDHDRLLLGADMKLPA